MKFLASIEEPQQSMNVNAFFFLRHSYSNTELCLGLFSTIETLFTERFESL